MKQLPQIVRDPVSGDYGELIAIVNDGRRDVRVLLVENPESWHKLGDRVVWDRPRLATDYV